LIKSRDQVGGGRNRYFFCCVIGAGSKKKQTDNNSKIQQKRQKYFLNRTCSVLLLPQMDFPWFEKFIIDSNALYGRKSIWKGSLCVNKNEKK